MTQNIIVLINAAQHSAQPTWGMHRVFKHFSWL